MLRLSILTVVAVVTLVSCASTPAQVGPVDPRGTWSYTLTDSHQNTWDSGTLTLKGQETSGSFDQVDYYQTADSGTWTWDEAVLTLKGPQNWTSLSVTRQRITGSWVAPNGDQGTFVLTKKP